MEYYKRRLFNFCFLPVILWVFLCGLSNHDSTDYKVYNNREDLDLMRHGLCIFCFWKLLSSYVETFRKTLTYFDFRMKLYEFIEDFFSLLVSMLTFGLYQQFWRYSKEEKNFVTKWFYFHNTKDVFLNDNDREWNWTSCDDTSNY